MLEKRCVEDAPLQRRAYFTRFCTKVACRLDDVVYIFIHFTPTFIPESSSFFFFPPTTFLKAVIPACTFLSHLSVCSWFCGSPASQFYTTTWLVWCHKRGQTPYTRRVVSLSQLPGHFSVSEMVREE